ncbi:hypothetical protein [Acetobacter lovaniensis]|uniref:Uncharacterized protein n=1 Tax=Acetobacter lovaniensis TaxID=104100 RepID=A0A841QEI4_9PROT|nr:hypothetical protein [Acetobacter lovaniensis]MBB6456951.1 hypothetical protein [Acetobacter lovaniensis]NHN81058.1 hypothetical protein [Acetobacter lovaniensis]GBQ69709.1 hypothetical protein AA0474_1996 [Acetobacter lovaniensis NRIC 0474]
MTQQNADQQQIEVGAIASDDLRLWLAREAQRQAEKRIASQVDIWGKFVTRATSCIGWAVTLTSAFAAISTQYQYRFLALPAMLAAMSAICACIILWPRRWNIPGDTPLYVMDMMENPKDPITTELEATEALAIRVEDGITANSLTLTYYGRALFAAFSLLIASILLAAIWVVLITI